MATARVSRINVTPVKSLRLQHPDSVELVADGAAEDRRFLIVDDGRRLYNGKRDTSLVRAAASWDPVSRVLAMELPGGGRLESEVARREPTVVEVYGRQVRGHVVNGPFADALSDLVGRSLALVERDDGAWATDSRPATLVSQASLGLIDGDGRRFRMLLELDGLEPLAEEEWRARRVRAGEALLLVGEPTPRCAVPSASPDSGVRDRDVLRELVERRGRVGGEACLGVYAEVLEPGLVRVGDESSRSRRELGAAADPDLILAAVPRAPVEPAVERLDLEARLLEQRVPLRGREPVEVHRGGLVVAAHGEDERPRARVPVRALEDPALALEPEPVRLLDVRRGRREDVEDESAVGLEHRCGSLERPELLRLVGHVEERPERDRHEWHALVDRRLAQVAEAEVEQLRDALPLRPLARHGEHARRLVDADHGDPGRAVGTAIRPVPTASSTTGPPDARASST